MLSSSAQIVIGGRLTVGHSLRRLVDMNAILPGLWRVAVHEASHVDFARLLGVR
jgi:hypothetical protein